MDKLIVALGIPSIGKTKAKALAKVLPTIYHILITNKYTADIEEAIGESSNELLYDWVTNNQELLHKLTLELISIKEDKPTTDTLSGLTYCITGKLSTYTRDQLTEIIELSGGKVVSGVSAKVNYLIAGDNAGSKLAKAESLGITILSESEFIASIK
jgi:DNA ligase (NAD+)